MVSPKSRSLMAKTNADRLALLDKIDKILRSQTVKESDLSKAVVATGTCPDMCPEKERYLRLQKNLLSSYEMGPNRTIDHNIVVKEYSRSSADQEEALPHELRPSSVLRITMDYMLTHVMHTIDYERTAEWYDFIWNRTRAIRKEISIQQLNDRLAIEVTEECARFHICCAHELCEMDVSNFDPKINNENLEKTMKTVLDMYDDVHLHQSVYQPPNEPEFQSYFILLNINRSSDVLSAVKNMKEDVRYSNEVRLAVSAFSALQSNNYSRFFTVVDKASYLQAALLHRYYKQVRQQAIRIMAKAYTSKPQCLIPIDDVIRSLRFNDAMELESFCTSHEISVTDGNVVLLRAVDYAAESLPSFCSRDISRKMFGRDLGDIIASGREPSPDIPQPSSSFDEDGYYIGPYAELLTMSASALKAVTASPSKKTNPVPTQDPTSLTDVYESLRQKGISNDIVKGLAKDLFIDIIQETTLDVSKKSLLAARCLVISDHVSIDVLNEAVTSDLRKLVSDVILYEKMEAERIQQEAEEAERERLEEIRQREEAERKRIELEQKMKELAECVDRSSLIVSKDLENEIVSELTQEIVLAAYKEERFERFSQITTDLLVNDIVSAMLKEVVVDCVKSERKSLHSMLNAKLQTRLTAIRWAKWRRHLEKVRLYRLSCQLFPCTSLSRDINQQISELLPTNRKRKSLDEEKPDSFAMQPFPTLLQNHRQLRDDVTRRIPMIDSIHYDVLPFNNIVYENIKRGNGDAIFWKLSLASTPTNKKSKWLSWLQHKFGFQSKKSTGIKDTITLENTHPHTDDDASTRSCVCCKMLFGEDRIKSEIFGTSSLVILLTENDMADWNQLKKYLDNLLSSIRPVPPIPLLVLCCALSTYNEDSLSDFLQTYSLLSSFRIVDFNSDDFVLNSNKLSSGIEWLAAESVTSPELRCCRLRDFLEEQLSRHYITPLYRDLGLRTEQNLPSLDPYFIVEIYNKILDDMCSCLTDQYLLEVSWPAPEFSKFKGAALFPRHNWNSHEEFVEVEELFEKLKLPSLPELHSCDVVKDVEELMIKYSHKSCPEQHHLALSISRSIKSFAGANELRDGVNFFHRFPWQRLIDAVASSIFEKFIYTEKGNMVVAFTEDSLKTIELPERFVNDSTKVEFQDLDDSEKMSLNPTLEPTLHSLELGTQSNLKKILVASTNVGNLPSAVDWLRTDDDIEQSASQVSVLKSEIRNEIEESERFEQDLKKIIASGEEFLSFS